MTEEFQAEIVAWARMQLDVPALATAIRRLVKIGLEANVTKRSVSKPGQKARAQELAAKTIDKMLDPVAPPEERAQLGADYLREELRRRLSRGLVTFTLEVQIADSGDR